MNYRSRLSSTLCFAGLAVQACGALADKAGESVAPDVYRPLMQGSHTLAALAPGGYSNSAELGVAYTSDDNFKAGQYNGLQEDGATLIGNLHWRQFSSDSYWRVSATDVGLDTREGQVTWGMADRLRIDLSFDSQLHVRNDSGRTPFSGQSDLTLPAGWVGGLDTGQFSALEGAFRGVERELERETLSLALDYRLNQDWRLDASVSHEEREGTTATGAAIYIDAASGDAALLPAPVDYRTTEFDVGLAYSGDRLHLQGRLDYSDFDNRDELLTWQNPYSSFGPGVAYPDGFGGLGLAPDNEQTRGRLTGQYIINATARIQFDG
ncbi:MAG: MtrB/PioB family outer membrane beta-barrel protein, partial [Halioglobus sp.]|nr:MtrB/PioB family outer membrane beta-barrel protein [Halioglobus sp.]